MQLPNGQLRPLGSEGLTHALPWPPFVHWQLPGTCRSVFLRHYRQTVIGAGVESHFLGSSVTV